MAKKQTILEDVDRANIQLVCANPHRGKEFFKTGAWLKDHAQLVCPHCGFASPLDDDRRLRMVSDHVQKTREMLARMHSDPKR